MRHAYPPIVILIALFGTAMMALLVFQVFHPPSYPFFGANIYDYYAKSLLHGQFDLPARVLRFEGHYAPDGKGYLYHGLGPVLTRLPFAPFVSFPTSWISPLSILAWAVAGNLLWYQAFATGLEMAEIDDRGVREKARIFLAAGVWFASPGLLLAANGTLYTEPVAMAYAVAAASLYIVLAVSVEKLPRDRAVVLLAILAGLALHSRPHIGVGLFATTCLFAAPMLLGGEMRQRLHAVAAMAVLGLFGAALLASNVARFGNATQMHGSFEPEGVQYGTVYWGYEDPAGTRARAFTEHGRFNPGRIVPNLLFYTAAPPDIDVTGRMIGQLEELHHDVTGHFGRARFERPRTGALFLWSFWFVLMVAGLSSRRLWRMPMLAATAGAGIGGLLLLSYPTITLRYHIDLWPLLALPAVFGIGPALRMLEKAPALRMAAPVLLVVSTLVTANTIGILRHFILEVPGSLPQAWSRDYCLERAAGKGFSTSRAEAICRLQEAGSDQE